MSVKGRRMGQKFSVVSRSHIDDPGGDLAPESLPKARTGHRERAAKEGTWAFSHFFIG